MMPKVSTPAELILVSDSIQTLSQSGVVAAVVFNSFIIVVVVVVFV